MAAKKKKNSVWQKQISDSVREANAKKKEKLLKKKDGVFEDVSNIRERYTTGQFERDFAKINVSNPYRSKGKSRTLPYKPYDDVDNFIHSLFEESDGCLSEREMLLYNLLNNRTITTLGRMDAMFRILRRYFGATFYNDKKGDKK